MLFSPAKLNLFFHVLKKRSDGYHEIASLYQAIDLGDFLTIKRSEGKDQLICTDPSIPTDETNLILQAAQLFREKTGVKERFSFFLDKRIPVEAGLGGGSSNAATTLWGLNRLLKTGVEDTTLTQWGTMLGADVSFFFSHGRAHCEGIGEKLSRLDDHEDKSVWVAKPNLQLSTPKVFQNLKISDLKNREKMRNDLEVSSFQLIPELKSIKEQLYALGFEHVLMTGSGTAFYCVGDVMHPQLSDTQFYRASFVKRAPNAWYKLPE